MGRHARQRSGGRLGRVAGGRAATWPNAGKGAILTTASVAGARFAWSTPGYSAAKAGVVGLTRWLAKELGPQGIRVNCLCPGLIETPLWHTPGEPYHPTFERWVQMTPLGRAGKAEEVARLALFLVSDEASFITGPGHRHRRRVLRGNAIRGR